MRLKAARKRAEKKRIMQQEEEEEGEGKEEEEQEELLKIKTVHRPDPNAKKILTVSKNQLKKVKDHGYFDGKNITHFDDDMNPIPD